MSDEADVAKAIADNAEHLAHIPPALKARAVNAVGPALQAHGEWLRLSTRQAVAAAVLVAVKAELDAIAGVPDVHGQCPACGGASLFLGAGGHITCSRIDCPDPSAADDLLHGGETALIQALGGDRTARVVAHTLHFHGHSYADVRRMTDERLLAVPGIGNTSLARIRAVIPEPVGAALAADLHGRVAGAVRSSLHKDLPGDMAEHVTEAVLAALQAGSVHEESV